MRPVTCVISTANLLHNLGIIRATAPRSKLMAMVKANAYGHGLVDIAQALDGKVDSLGVASIDEAMLLRRAGIRSPITLIEGVFEPGEFYHAAQQNFQCAFHTMTQVRWLLDNPPAGQITVWLKVDTGMGRLGFLPETGLEAYELLAQCPSVHFPIGVMSHFARADESDHEMNKIQAETFRKFTRDHCGPKSLCNSAAIFAFPEQHHEWVRPGLSLYGATPLVGKSASSLGLKPVMTFGTKLISVKTIKRGDSLGYGARFVCPEDMPVGVMAVGYGDGYPRSAQDGTPVLVNGIRCPLVGRVSMDMATVDLRPCPNAKVNDNVVLWGEGLPVEDVAATTSNINYDLLTGLQRRVRVVVK